ncbi:two-component system OmpR family sensor kinase [Pararhizobium capsulatum DSM 1112]|uniref:histidine kinase n=1 Tax=Pararhizobium capsulatum DSM 1112 TaxID=1121113 RepID=A0ABU0BJN2_9HYPH|nr:ATP-binding protein [Pararhizobium capsulatum]MDQ0318460.1 two-component system OmpR family sensor kinase [Pararhizobium capsulatum DSM 1112]
MAAADRTRREYRTSMIRRLTIALTAVTVIVWLFTIGLGLAIMQDEYSEIFDNGLRQAAERLLPIVVDDLKLKATTTTPQETTERQPSNDEYLTFQARDRKGMVLLHSRGAGAKPFDVPLVNGFTDTPSQRIYTTSTDDNSIFVQVADSLKHRREALFEGGIALFLPLIILVPASIFAIFLATRRFLEPINQLRAEIAQKDGGNLASVADKSLPIELKPIARSVNILLRRLRAAFEAEREFTANSAHELRTPIAAALAQTQRLRAEVPAEFKERTRRIERSLSNLARLAEKLLQMSRAEAGLGIVDKEIDLLPVLGLIVQDFERSSLGSGRMDFIVEDGVDLQRATSQDAFAIVVRNVLENALIHSPPKSKIDVRVQKDGCICILNDANVIEPQVLAGLTTRFMRGPTKAAGSGLGLAIAKRLVEEMKGRLILASPARGKTAGFEARIEL